MSKIYFQNSIDGVPAYSAEDFTSVLATFITNGILLGEGKNFSVTFSSSSSKMSPEITVSQGKAIIDGFVYATDLPQTFTLETPTAEKAHHLVQVYRMPDGSMGIEVVDATVSEQVDKKTLPLAIVTVQTATSATPHIVLDKRVYATSVMNTMTTSDLLSPAQDTLNALLEEYEQLTSTVTEGGHLTSLGMVRVACTGQETAFTIPTDVNKAMISVEKYLNGRIYNGSKIQVDIQTGKVIFTAPAPNTAEVLIFYPKAGE